MWSAFLRYLAPSPVRQIGYETVTDSYLSILQLCLANQPHCSRLPVSCESPRRSPVREHCQSLQRPGLMGRACVGMRTRIYFSRTLTTFKYLHYHYLVTEAPRCVLDQYEMLSGASPENGSHMKQSSPFPRTLMHRNSSPPRLIEGKEVALSWQRRGRSTISVIAGLSLWSWSN